MGQGQSARVETAWAEPLVFVHVPKTAGTSFRNALQLQLGPAALALDYGKDKPVTSPLVRRHVYEEPDMHALRRAVADAGVKVVCGHISATRYAEAFEARNLMVFVREPIQRLISEFQHFRRHHGYTGSFPEFYRTPGFSNRQLNLAGGVAPEDYGFLGVTECYTESVALANRKFGWNLEVLADNLGRPSLALSYQLVPEMLAEAIELNRQDIEYYEQAVAVFESRR